MPDYTDYNSNAGSWNPATQPYPYSEQAPQYNAWGSTSESSGQYANPYDPRIGNGQLPPGIQGSANRAYVGYVQPDQTAGYQITNLLDSNNPYMQNARRQAFEFSNKRGVANSSIAAGNSQRAAIEAGAPLAMQDANTYANQQRQNIDALNQREIANLNRRAAGGGGNFGQQTLALQGQLQLQREQLAFQGEQAELARQGQAYNNAMGYGYSTGLQNNQFSNQLNNSMQLGAFQGAIQSGLSSQNYYQNAALGAMNNPAIIGNPQGFQNYLGYMQGPFQNDITNYLNMAFGGM
jgi:hypothetical protein